MAELSLVQLRHFCAVAELGSIAEAARQRHVSATAVGAAITSLERTLGTRLCKRERSRGIVLTPSGHHFYREARRLIRDADDLLKPDPESPEVYSGPLRIGAFRNTAPVVLPELLEHFEQEHPEIEVEFVTGMIVDLVELMVAGEINCFFTYDTFRTTSALPYGLTLEVLYWTEFKVVLSATHPFASRESLSMADLQDEPLIVYESNPSKKYSAPLGGQLDPARKVRYRTSDYELMRSMVAHGLGYSITLTPMPPGPSYEGRRITNIRIDPPLNGPAMAVVRPDGRWQHPGTRYLIDLAHRLVAAGGLGASM
jgi:DNA-binding transcriptional LysR family regulator